PLCHGRLRRRPLGASLFPSTTLFRSVLPPRSDVLGHLLGDDLACDRVSERLLGAVGGGASVDVEGEQGGAGGGPSGPRFGFGGGGHFCSWVWRICSVRAWATAG